MNKTKNTPSFVAGIKFNRPTRLDGGPVEHATLNIRIALIIEGRLCNAWGVFLEFFETPDEEGYCWAWLAPFRNDIPELLEEMSKAHIIDLYSGNTKVGQARLCDPSPPYILDCDPEIHGVVRKHYHPKLFSESALAKEQNVEPL